MLVHTAGRKTPGGDASTTARRTRLNGARRSRLCSRCRQRDFGIAELHSILVARCGARVAAGAFFCPLWHEHSVPAGQRRLLWHIYG